MPKYNPNAETPQVQLLTGDYPFEIVGVTNKISQGQKTRGCDQRDVKLDFFSDDSFRVKVASITDTLYDHESCDWKYSVLARCIGFNVPAGANLDVDEGWIGYRGWAHCSPEPDKNDPKKLWNRVRLYYTDRKHIPRNEIKREPIPFADAPEETPFQ